MPETIMDTLNKGHNRKNLSVKDTLWGPKFIILVHFNLWRKEDNLSAKDKKAGPKRVHYSEAPPYTDWLLHRHNYIYSETSL